MKDKIMIIDDEKRFIDDIFKPKLSQWNVDYHILSNKTYGNISEAALPDFTREVLDIIQLHRDDLAVIFLDLGLNESDQSASLGFKLALSLRDRLFDIPIIALTRFGKPELVEEGYLYDLDRYIKKTEFGDLGAVGFHGIVTQAIRKREKLILKIPQYYDQLKNLRKENYSSVSAFGITFTRKSINLEDVLTDAVELMNADKQTKRMTVILFSDLCNSVEIKEKQGFFEGLYMTRMHNEIITNVIHSSGGSVVKYIGDCVMARFDYADSSLVDAASINAAIKINEALCRHNKNYRNDCEYKLNTKIGMALGKVIDFYGNDPQGISVDIAARLQSLAGPSEIIVSSKLQSFVNAAEVQSDIGKATNRMADEYFIGPHEKHLKGVQKDVKYYLINWAERTS